MVFEPTNSVFETSLDTCKQDWKNLLASVVEDNINWHYLWHELNYSKQNILKMSVSLKCFQCVLQLQLKISIVD
jgi:adenosine deaminase